MSCVPGRLVLTSHTRIVVVVGVAATPCGTARSATLTSSRSGLRCMHRRGRRPGAPHAKGMVTARGAPAPGGPRRHGIPSPGLANGGAQAPALPRRHRARETRRARRRRPGHQWAALGAPASKRTSGETAAKSFTTSIGVAPGQEPRRFAQRAPGHTSWASSRYSPMRCHSRPIPPAR